MRISKERETVVAAVTAGAGRAPASAARLRPWVVAASAVALIAVLGVRNRFLFTSRLYAVSYTHLTLPTKALV